MLSFFRGLFFSCYCKRQQMTNGWSSVFQTIVPLPQVHSLFTPSPHPIPFTFKLLSHSPPVSLPLYHLPQRSRNCTPDSHTYLSLLVFGCLSFFLPRTRSPFLSNTTTCQQ
ncbi:unnamed protein product [Mortierella alpina]